MASCFHAGRRSNLVLRRATGDIGRVDAEGFVYIVDRAKDIIIRAAIPKILNRDGGSIVNVASIAVSCCVGGSAYAAAKGGILSYTRHISHELAARHVRVNCVSPGFMPTPMTTGERIGLSPEDQEARLAGFGGKVPMQHCGSRSTSPTPSSTPPATRART